jgi:hypothetical protein
MDTDNCTIITEDAYGNAIDVRCGSEADCNALLILLLLLFLIWAVPNFFGWLFADHL